MFGGICCSSILDASVGLPVFVDNDACLAALGEVAVIGPGSRRVLFVTVGSGIGVVFVTAGKVARIAHGATGCAGHLLVNPTCNVRCPLGCKGCLETVASGRGIVYAAERAIAGYAESALAQLSRSTPLSAKTIADLAAVGDPLAHEIITQAGFWLGVGLARWATIYGPDLVLVGGTVAKSGDHWLSTARRAMRELGVPRFTQKLRIRTAVLGNQAGRIGAALISRLLDGAA
ncbi:MAG: ROK family protein [Chthoniobacterales bacterium]